MARVSVKNWLKVLNVVALVGLVVAVGYLYIENRDLSDQLTLTTEQKNARLIDEINEVYDLPDESPVVAVVTDPEQFKSEYPTFDSAQNGDYLLFFRKARLNVLYRQSEKKVLQTANVVVPIAIELIGTQAAIDETVTKLADFGNQITVTPTIVDGITQSFVFDVDADQGDETQSVADQLGIDVGSTLPSTITPGDQTEIVVAVSSSSDGAGSALLEQGLAEDTSENQNPESQETTLP